MIAASPGLIFAYAKRNAFSTCCGELLVRPAPSSLNARHGRLVWRSILHMRSGSFSMNVSPIGASPNCARDSSGVRLTR